MSDAQPGERFAQGMKIACPDGWTDKSMLILNGPHPGPTGVTPNIVVTRETSVEDLPPAGPARLEAFVDRQIEQMKSALAGLVIIERIHATEQVWSAELRIHWSSDGIPLMQWITYANSGDALIMATTTAGQADFAAAEPQFRDILKTVRLS